LLEDEALRKILAAGGIKAHPDTLAELKVGLQIAYGLYLDESISRGTDKEFIKFLTDTAKKASSLANDLDITSPSGCKFNVVLSKLLFDIDIEKIIALLRRLEEAANGVQSCLAGAEDIIGGVGAYYVLRPSMMPVKAQKKRGNKEYPETRLFLNLQQLFVKLGGGRGISDNGPLYKFTVACAAQIDGISMLNHERRGKMLGSGERFRTLMKEAKRRRQHLASSTEFERLLAIRKQRGIIRQGVR
jgi:hypothetical protein